MWTLLNEVQRILIHRHFFTYLGVDHGNASSYKTLTIFLIKRPFFERLTKRLKFEHAPFFYQDPGVGMGAVWLLDRLGRSLKHLISYVSKLEKKAKGFIASRKQLIQKQPLENLCFTFLAHFLSLSVID